MLRLTGEVGNMIVTKSLRKVVAGERRDEEEGISEQRG